MNGSDGSTTFTDDGTTGHSPVANGNAQIDTAQSKFGGAGGLFDGTGDYVSVPDHDDWDINLSTNNPFTVDFWVRFSSLASENSLFSQGLSTVYYHAIQDSGELYFWSVSGPDRLRFKCDWSPSVDTWYHIAFVRSASARFIFIDGVEQTLTLDVNGNMASSNQPFSVGRSQKNITYLSGWLDGFRLSNGIARWTSDFPPPTSEYTRILITSSLNQRYGLDAPTLIKAVLNQRYALDAYILNQASLNQRYTLDAYTLTESSLNQRYVLTGAALKTATLNQRYSLSGVTLNQTSLNQLWVLVAPTGPFLLSLNQRYILNGFHSGVTFYYAVTYTLTLTGAPDSLTDIILPMSSFQERLKKDDPSWLSVVVPNGRTYADSVAARPNGEIVIDRNGIKEDGSLESIEIGRVALEEIRTDEGGRSSALTLSGHKTTSGGTPKGVALDKVKVRSEYKGKRTVQIKMDSAIVPGDQAEMDGQIFTIGEITRYVNSARAQMTVKEK